MIPKFLPLPLYSSSKLCHMIFLSQITEYNCKFQGVMLPLDSDKPIEKAE